jgi:hypothetical protein
MKKGFRIAFLVILFIGGTAMLYWYFLMKRGLPKHARCIPKNAIAVLTLNMRELALDNSSGGHLFPEMANKRVIPKEFEPFVRAIEANGGLGLNETADVLAFFYQNGDAAFFGVSVSVKDSLKFGKLIREQLPKEFLIQPFTLRGATLVRFDTSAAVLGWNNDVALFLYPFSNHGSSITADQCARLLQQTEDQSILTNESFCNHELSSFDAGIWMQTKPFLEFTQGGKLFRTAFDDVKTISLALDFQNGELDIRRIIEGDGKKHNTPYNGPLLLSCDPKQVKGFFKIPMDFSNDSLLEAYENSPPFNMLPFDDDKLGELAKTLDGNCTLLIHDTLSYQTKYISYDYDADFNPIQKPELKRETTTGMSFCYGITNEKKASDLITAWAKEDSIPMNGNSWLFDDNGEQFHLTISGKILTYSNWPQSDGKKRELFDELQALDVYFPVGDYLTPSNQSILPFFFSKYGDAQKLFSDNIKLATISQPLVQNSMRSSQMRLIMANKEVNALVQFEEIFRKILEGK